MKILNSIDEFISGDEPVALTVGSFDGVHTGHRQILQQLKDIALANQGKTLVVTFSPHPRIFFNPDTDLGLLTTDSEKAELIANQGIDYLVFQAFDKEFAGLSPEEFIRRLRQNLKMKDLLLGYDHRFGKDRSGDFNHIQSLEKKYDFKTHRIDAVKIGGKSVSSTLIRQALQNGDIETANEYLGYPYFITGKVIKGNQLGRKLGYPTANIEVGSRKPKVRSGESEAGSIKSENIDSSIHQFIDSSTKYKLIPKQGVYLVKSNIDGQDYYGMMNIGFRPTIDGKKQIKEVHFFDLNKDLYGKDLRISFLKRLRDEQKFPSLEALKEQLQRDEVQARGLASQASW